MNTHISFAIPVMPLNNEPMIQRIFMLLFLIASFACGKTLTADLSERVESFNESLRWSSIKAAAAFMDEENKRTLMEKYSKEFQKSKIVEYSILDVALDGTKKSGTVLVEFSYYDELTQLLKYRQELQTWNLLNGTTWAIKDSRTVSQK